MLFSFLSLKGLSAFAANHVFLTVAAGVTGTVATAVVVDDMSRNPMLYDRLGKKLAMGAGVMFTPILAAEDLARLAGDEIPPEGFLHNMEGKSIWEIWNESKPLTQAEKDAVQASLQ